MYKRQIFTGLDVALGSAWTTLVAAELLASTKGLGFMIQQDVYKRQTRRTAGAVRTFGYLIKLVEMHILAGKIRVCIFAIFSV